MKMSDYQRIHKIVITVTQLLQVLHDEQITPDVISAECKAQWLVTTPLYNIGEHVYNLSRELKSAHSEIPWAKISGLRHRLIHNYDDTNWNIINDILFHDLPLFAAQIQELYQSMGDS